LNSHDDASAQPRALAAREVLRLSILDFTRGMPPGVLIWSHMLPEILRMLTYILIARLAAGPDAASLAACGTVALITVRMTVSEQSGLPVGDVWAKTIGANATGTLPLHLQYMIRSLPLQMVAAVDSLLMLILIKVLFQIPSPTASAWLLSLPCIPSGAAFGTAVSVACLGRNMHNMVHNIAASLLTVCSGAIISVDTVPALRTIGSLLPVTHSARLLQSSAPSPFVPALAGRELLNALMWYALGSALYTLMFHHTKRTGNTYLGN